MNEVKILGSYVEGKNNPLSRIGELGVCGVVDMDKYEELSSSTKQKIKDKFKMYRNYGADGKKEYIKGTFFEKSITGIDDVMKFVNGKKLSYRRGGEVMYDILMDDYLDVIFREVEEGRRLQKETLTEQEELKVKIIEDAIDSLGENYREIRDVHDVKRDEGVN